MTSLTLTYLFLLPVWFVLYVTLALAAPSVKEIGGTVIVWTFLLSGLGALMNDLWHQETVHGFNRPRLQMLFFLVVLWAVGLALADSSHAFDYAIEFDGVVETVTTPPM